jgi:NarL family two-component system response regulator LiaR
MTSPDPIQILIVDDHPLVRSGLRMFLLAFDDLILAGEAANGFEAVTLAEQLAPDVILMDLIMPSMDGLRATCEIHKKFPHIKIIALTSFSDPTLIREAIDAGVSGYLFKNATANELANAIRAVHAGNTIFSPEAAQELAKSQTSSAASYAELTTREKEVLTLMALGKGNTELSEELTLSISTIKFHVSNILAKLNARSRAEAVSIALTNHLVDLSGLESEK